MVLFHTFVLEMKTITQKIASLLMACIVLLSTMSFTIDMHYCGDILVDTSVFTAAETCGMELQESSKECSVSKKNCCSDTQIVFEGQDELKNSFDSLATEQQLFISSFVYTYLNLFEGLEGNVIPFKDYSPPLLVKDIQKLDGVYLI